MTGFRIKIGVVLVAAAVLGWQQWLVRVQPAPVIAPNPASILLRGGMPEMLALEPLALDLNAPSQMLAQGVEVHFCGNGRDQLEMTASNRSDRPVVLQIRAGQVLKNSVSSVVVVRACSRTVAPGETVEQELQTAAISSANKIGMAVYRVSSIPVPRLNELLAHVGYHEEMTLGAVQTAVLALTENLPANAFARYARPDADLPSPLDTTPFRVDTADLMSALIALRDIGMPDALLSITVDPQLKCEAMIDPLAHAYAMDYYKIPFENEWSYWKNQLLQGDPAIRHYALYGIARFFPDVALQMLPKWARATNLSATYRISAIRALAETGRPEALSVLQQFEYEFGGLTELGKSAHLAAEYLDLKVNHEASNALIAFHENRDLGLRSPTVEIGLRASKD